MYRSIKSLIIAFAAGVMCFAAGAAENIVTKSPGYFSEPIRDGYPLFSDSIVVASGAEEIVIPDVGIFGRPRDYGEFANLRKVTFGNVDYLPGGLLQGLPALEEVVFNGMIGHFDCTFISDCPKLKSIVFRGPVSTTGGPVLAYNLPSLEKVTFESVVVNLGIN